MNQSEFQEEIKALADLLLEGELDYEGYKLAVARLMIVYKAEYVSPAEY